LLIENDRSYLMAIGIIFELHNLSNGTVSASWRVIISE
jgi:hypothetical protein